MFRLELALSAHTCSQRLPCSAFAEGSDRKSGWFEILAEHVTSFLQNNGNIIHLAKHAQQERELEKFEKRTKPACQYRQRTQRRSATPAKDIMTSHGKLRKEKGSLAEYETQIKGKS